MVGTVQAVQESTRRPQQQRSRSLQYVGTLQVLLLDASDLLPGRRADGGARPPDPFCEVQLGDQVLISRVVKRTAHPKWNQSLLFTVPTLDAAVRVTVKDYDEVRAKVGRWGL
jgi:Ca2+-dependent lipid-binding protein